MVYRPYQRDLVEAAKSISDVLMVAPVVGAIVLVVAFYYLFIY
jgi:hypothetical protein